MQEKFKIIPENLDQAINLITDGLSVEEKQLLMEISENEMCQFHHTVGRDLRNNWKLWEGPKISPLVKYFKKLGIFHADDMSGIILDSVWRVLHNIPINLGEQVKFYQEYWKIFDNEKQFYLINQNKDYPNKN